jgi:histidine triad (HIT) family protein
MPTIFTQIINRELPAKIFHETDEVIVIADYRPRAPLHLLIIPKTEYTNFYETPPEVLAMMNRTAKMIAEKLGISDHFQILINNGLKQEVPHLHFHFMSNKGVDKLTFEQT